MKLARLIARSISMNRASSASARIEASRKPQSVFAYGTVSVIPSPQNRTQLNLSRTNRSVASRLSPCRLWKTACGTSAPRPSQDFRPCSAVILRRPSPGLAGQSPNRPSPPHLPSEAMNHKPPLSARFSEESNCQGCSVGRWKPDRHPSALCPDARSVPTRPINRTSQDPPRTVRPIPLFAGPAYPRRTLRSDAGEAGPREW